VKGRLGFAGRRLLLSALEAELEASMRFPESGRAKWGLAAALLFLSCAKEPVSPVKITETGPDPASFQQSVVTWQKDRLARLTADDGWLTLVGLDWLKDGANTLGSDPKSDLVLPGGKTPAHIGIIRLAHRTLILEPLTGSGLTVDGRPAAKTTLLSDADGAAKPTLLKLDTLSFFVVQRGQRFGLRIKDSQSTARTGFRGLDYFPIDPKWRVEAHFQPYNPPKSIRIANVLGMESDEIAPGSLIFKLQGREYRIDPILETGEKDLFLIIRDQTSGRETYPAARYLYAHPPGADGKVIIDFNRAYNPPCAFTHFATCPLPPPQNRLPIRIEAGEKTYDGAGHSG
jgi:uncharacterized protein (DUF1684 family)